MKLFIKSICAATAVCILFTFIPFSAQCKNISREVFRLHILAASDSKADQSLKLKVRDRVLEYTKSLYRNAESLKDAEELSAKQLQAIADAAKTEVVRNGYDYPVKAEIKRMFFDTRYYGDITMPAGFYNALRITIGSGSGHNWWCVMYPSVCVGASLDYNALKEKTTDEEYRLMTAGEYKFKFKIAEYFEKICSLFS